LLPGKNAGPSVREIKERHVQQQHGIMPAGTSSKHVAQAAPWSALIQFCFHFGILFVSQTLNMIARRHHGAVGGFFDASQGRADDTSFEGGNKSGATKDDC